MVVILFNIVGRIVCGFKGHDFHVSWFPVSALVTYHLYVCKRCDVRYFYKHERDKLDLNVDIDFVSIDEEFVK